MATPNLSYDNKFSTTLSSGITATDTTIPLTALPTASEGYLVLEPDSSTGWEIIYYTSKTGSAVVVPSVAAGRGVGGSTAASHSSGATVRCDTVAEFFKTLQDTTALTGLHTQNTERGFDHVASGCVWTGDSLGSTRAASMTSGVAYINGRRHTVAAVTSRTFTASKDTYVDLLYSTVDNIATPVYTEVTNNAASPALASNSIRIGIVVTGATTIAAAGSINQGQETKVLPIASSIAYSVTDSLGNLICNRNSASVLLGYRQAVANQGTITSMVDATGLSSPIIVPSGRKLKITTQALISTTVADDRAGLDIYEDGVAIFQSAPRENLRLTGTNYSMFGEFIYTPTAGSHTYKVQVGRSTGTGTLTLGAAATNPAYIKLELI